MTVYTIGHSRRPLEALIDHLGGAKVTAVADVRAVPRSRANPQFNAEGLARSLTDAGIAYRHLPALGGRRRAADGPSPNALWREPAFRAYADYALGGEFRTGLAALKELAEGHTVAVMCAEADWRHCHRQIVADYLLTAGHPVAHILPDGTHERARPTPGAVAHPDGTVTYASPQGQLL